MKIKEVCQQTGLTDRTVRYYIECGLLTPNNSESYTGRRSFHFTTADVERLETIKVLRDAGFSVEQIKVLQSDRPSREVIQKRLRELEVTQEHDRELYDSLKKADLAREVSAEELVIILKSPNPSYEAPAVEETAPLHKLLSKAKIAITVLSVSFLAFAVLMAAVFLFMGGPDWLANRNLNGTAVLTVYEDGEFLSAQEFSLSGMAGVRNIIRGENGYSFSVGYGETRAAVCVDGLVVDCGFFNVNNWHHPHIRVDMEHTDNGVLVTQTVTYKTDHDRVETLKNTAYATEGQVSVFMHGIPS